MNANILYPTESLFVDQPNVTIPYREETLVLNQLLATGRNARPFSDMGRGKFRRLFNRHTAAFRR
ncbi:MAG: hypothetical protein WA960_05950 [Tunicatimonas sp.]